MDRRAWLITALLILFQIVAFADKAVLGLVAVEAIPDLGITPVQFGFIGSAFFFLYAVVSVVTGFLASRFSVKWIIFTMGIVWAVMQFPMLLGGGAAVLLVTRIVLGGAEGPATAMSLTSAHSWFKPQRRALPSNLIAVGSVLGPVIAAPLLTVVIGVWGWRWAFGVLGIIGLLWTLAWLILGSDGPYAGHGRRAAHVDEDAKAAAPTEDPERKHVSTSAVDAQQPVRIWRALMSMMFLAAVLGGGANFLTQGFVTTWLPQYLSTAIGLSLPQVGLVTTFPWIMGVLVLLLLGVIGHRLMQRGHTAHAAIAVPFGLSATIAGISFLLVQTTSGPLAVALVTVGAGCSLVYPMAASAVGFSVGAKQRPILMATLGGVASIGAIISPTLVGWLMDRAGYVAAPKGTPLTAEMAQAMTTGVNQAFTITGIALVIGGLLCVLFLRPEALGRKLQTHHLKR